jgi:twitching motility protein PilT
MQTFDQSLMGLLKQSIITYDEALRQATNRDDFALRVSGVSATSDSKWDDFEGKAHPGAAAAPAAPRPPPVAQVPRASPSAPMPAPGPAAAVSFAPTQVSQIPRPPAAPAPAAAPKPAAAAGTDDDFQIERF